MATHIFEDDFFRSANQYRKVVAERAVATAQKRDDERILNNLRSAEKFVQREMHIASHYASRKVESELRQDAVGKEMIEAKQTAMAVSGLIGGVALLLAATAAEAVHSYKMVDAEIAATKALSAEADRRMMNNDLRNRARIEEFNKNQKMAVKQLNTTKNALYDTYKSAKVSANRIISAAKDEFQKTKGALDKEAESVARQCKSEIERINADAAIIDKASAIQSAINARDFALSGISARMVDAEAKLNGVVATQNAIVDEAIRRYKMNVQADKGVVVSAGDSIAYHAEWDRQARSDQLATRTNNWSHAVAENRQKAVAAAKSGAEHYGPSTTLYAVVGGRHAGRFVDAFNEKHLSIGKDLAYSFGSEEEVALLKKVDADADAKAKAEEENLPYNPTTSQKEREDAERIVAKYAGDVSSKKAMRETISNHAKAIIEYKAKIAELNKQIKETKKQIEVVDKQIAQAQEIVNQIAADNKALRTGLNADGSKLTAEQKDEITKRLQSQQSSAFYLEEISKLQTKRNALVKQMDKSVDQKVKTENAMYGLTLHVSFLQKHGSVVIDTQAKSQNKFKANFERRGSKTASNFDKKAAMAFRHSTMMASRKISQQLSEGNDLHRELLNVKSGMRKIDKFGRSYEKSINVATSGLKFIGKSTGHTVKLIGKHTTLGQHLSEKLKVFNNTKFAQRAKKITTASGKGIGILARTPGKILMAPMKIATAPKRAAQSALRYTRKSAARTAGKAAYATGRALKAGAKVTGKAARYGINSTLGKKEFYKKFQAKQAAREARRRAENQRFREFNNKVLGTVARPFRAVGKAVSGAVSGARAAIASAVSAVVSAVMTVVGGMVCAASSLLFVIVLVAVLMSALASALGVVQNWVQGWMQLTAQEQSYVKNNPEYLLEQAINYRDAELELFDLFAHAANDRTLIRANTAPVYYALYDNGIHFFGLTGEKKLKKDNDVTTYDDAYRTFRNRAPDAWDHLYTDIITQEEDDDVYFEKGCFKSDVKYYDKIQIAYYKSDALLTDGSGNYVTKTVGGIEQYVLKDDAQPSAYEISNAKDALALVDSLYSTKHDSMQLLELYAYLGIGASQLQKHGTQQISNNLFWASHKFIYLSGTDENEIKFHETNRYSGRVDSECNHYTIIRRVYEKVVKNEETGEETTTYHTRDFYVCRGHAELKVAVVVSLLEDESLFSDAMRVQGQEFTTIQGSFEFPLQVNIHTGKIGLGVVIQNEFHPSSDWAPDSQLRDLALVKHDANFVYSVFYDGETSARDIEIIHNYTTDRDKDYPFSAFKKMPQGQFTFGLCFNDKVYYVESFISGEQKNLIYYVGEDHAIMSLVVNGRGVPSIKFS